MQFEEEENQEQNKFSNIINLGRISSNNQYSQLPSSSINQVPQFIQQPSQYFNQNDNIFRSSDNNQYINSDYNNEFFRPSNNIIRESNNSYFNNGLYFEQQGNRVSNFSNKDIYDYSKMEAKDRNSLTNNDRNSNSMQMPGFFQDRHSNNSNNQAQFSQFNYVEQRINLNDLYNKYSQFRMSENLYEEEKVDETQQGCKCEKSQCLKLYCICFKQQRDCTSACKCVNCHNTIDHLDERQQAINQIKQENPLAFDTSNQVESTSKQTQITCKCVKSQCKQKYCECFNQGIKCGPQCQCKDCLNFEQQQPEQQKQPGVYITNIYQNNTNNNYYNNSQFILK